MAAGSAVGATPEGRNGVGSGKGMTVGDGVGATVEIIVIAGGRWVQGGWGGIKGKWGGVRGKGGGGWDGNGVGGG